MPMEVISPPQAASISSVWLRESTGSVTLVSLLVYNYAFKSNEMGMACAMAWVMFIIIALLTVIAFGSQKHWVYYAD